MKLDYKKTALILVDLQNDFLPGGSLSINVANSPNFPIDPPHIQSKQILDYTTGVLNYTKYLKSHGCTIITTRDWHPADHPSFASYGGIWPDHCIQNERGAEYANEELKTIYDVEILKGVSHRGNGYTGFGEYLDSNQSLALALVDRGIETILVCGLATDYCVRTTAVDGAKVTTGDIVKERERKVIVDEWLKAHGKEDVFQLTLEEWNSLWDKVVEVKDEFQGEKAFKVIVVEDLIHGVARETSESSFAEMGTSGVVILPSTELQ
ncbi:hypothetical protein HK098_004276 [Nowakowskiella sp. JEL0407]|nr:hypothetical protein HK098_004276 [Nowakowskiella sp. JEL0407]